MEREMSEINVQWDMKTRLAFQVKLCAMMGGGDFEKWIEKYAGIFHDLLEDDPSLMGRAYDALDVNFNAPNAKESPLVREIADELISRYNLGKEAEPDSESLDRAA